jgi:hypothetical protein
MLFRETVAVYCENHTEHTNTLCGQNAEFWYVKATGTSSNHRAVKGLVSFILVRQSIRYVYSMLLRNYLDLLISYLLRTVVNPTSAKRRRFRPFANISVSESI